MIYTALDFEVKVQDFKKNNIASIVDVLINSADALESIINHPNDPICIAIAKETLDFNNKLIQRLLSE